MRRLFLIGCVSSFLLFSQSLFSQRNSNSTSGESRITVAVLLEKSRDYLELNPDSALAFAREATKLSRSSKDFHYQAEAAFLEGQALAIKGEFDAARSSFTRAHNRYARAEDTVGIFEAGLGLGTIEMETQNYSKALDQFRETQELAPGPGDEGRILSLDGSIFQRIGSLDLAYDYFQQALDKYIEAGDSVGMARSYSNLGAAMFELEEYDAALNSFNQALDLQVAQKDKMGEMMSRCKIGTVQMKRKQFRTAEVSHRSSLSIAQELGIPRGIADNCKFLGDIALGAGEPDSALVRYRNALAIWENPGIQPKVAETRVGLAKALLAKESFQESIEMGESAIEAAKEVGNWNLVYEARSAQFEAAEGMKEFQAALDYQRLKEAAQKKIFEQERRNKAVEMTVRFEQEAAVKQLEMDQRLQAASLDQQASKLRQGRMIGYGLFAMLIVIGLFSFFLFRTSRKRYRTNQLLKERSIEVQEKNVELEAARKELETANNNLETLVDERTEALKDAVDGLITVNDELDTFIYRASHDLLGPIARLKGLIMLLKMNGAADNKYARLIDDVAIYMDKGLRKLIMVHDIRKPHEGTEPVNLMETLAAVEHKMSDIPGVESPVIHTKDEVGCEVMLHSKLTGIILENLLENACIFRKDVSNPAPEVQLTFSRDNGHLVIETRDEGIGIPDDIKNDVFNIFFRGSERSKGSGTGLYLVKLSAEHMGGSVQLQSQENEFTSVQVRIPFVQAPAVEAQKEKVDQA